MSLCCATSVHLDAPQPRAYAESRAMRPTPGRLIGARVFRRTARDGKRLREPADFISVFLAKNHHRPGRAGFLDISDLPGDFVIGQDVIVDDLDNARDLFIRQRTRIVEIEATDIGIHQRAALLCLFTDHVFEGPVRMCVTV